MSDPVQYQNASIVLREDLRMVEQREAEDGIRGWVVSAYWRMLNVQGFINAMPQPS